MGIAGFSIVKRQQMVESELAEVRELEGTCNRYEGLILKLNWDMLQERQTERLSENQPENQHRPGEMNDFLCYSHEGKLVGYLALYGFGRPEIEVSGMVHPTYRRRGIFSALLEQAGDECRQRKIKDFLFICERNSKSGLAFMKKKAAGYDHSEHRMELSGGMEPLKAESPVELRAAGPDNLEMLAELDAVCFNIPVEESKYYYKSLLSRDELYISGMNGIDIGMIKLLREKDEMFIFGFGIKPEFRGKGYGRATLARAVNIALARKPEKVSLEVDCVNDKALSLYKSCGFQTIATYDYYRLAI